MDREQETHFQILHEIEKTIKKAFDNGINEDVVLNELKKIEHSFYGTINLIINRKNILEGKNYEVLDGKAIYSMFKQRYAKNNGMVREIDYFVLNAKKIASFVAQDLNACKAFNIDPN